MVFFRVLWRAQFICFCLWQMLFTWLGAKLGLRWLWWQVARRGRPYQPLRNETMVRRMFERLGPTFVKLGQVIASSAGLFPKRYSDEFQKCLDRVPPFDVELLKQIVAQDLGKPIEELFGEFEPHPLGSASIAQVHGATLKDGYRVVIKVQRPGIAGKVDSDLWWMRRGAWVSERFFLGARLANASGVIDDFDRTIHEELDFRKEATNLREFNQIMATHKVKDVRAPVPVEGMVTARVLVMERFEGFKADAADAIKAAGIDPEIYLRKGLRAWLMTVMLYGFFHGDAHAGNLMMMPDGPSVGFLDFGIIGRFTDLQRNQVLKYVLAFSAQDYEALANVMLEIGAIAEGIDRLAFVADLRKTYGPLIEKSVSDIKYEEILPQITAVAYTYGVKLPREFLLILKQLLFFDRYAKQAAPTLNVFSDFYLVDFLFTPDAMNKGLDFNQLMPLLRQIQARGQAQKAAG
jgi:predicted unusual protein kinase regulating ubiquinone biosynthesis (AarF/ABC1/UbiB family)